LNAVARPNLGRDDAVLRRIRGRSASKHAISDGERGAFDPMWRFNTIAHELSCSLVVVSQQAAKALTTQYFAISFPHLSARRDDRIAQPLVISFAVEMGKELTDSISQRPFSEDSQAFETLGFQRSPRWTFLCESYDQVNDHLADSWPADLLLTVAVIPFLSDQRSVPS
jgi:hypothetical protein